MKKKRHKWRHHTFKDGAGDIHISYSECTVCGIKRKTWRYRPTQYQTPEGVTTSGKAPACEPKIEENAE